MLHKFRAYQHDTRGVVAIEYILLAGLMAVIVIAAAVTMGDAVEQLFQRLVEIVVNGLSSSPTPTPPP